MPPGGTIAGLSGIGSLQEHLVAGMAHLKKYLRSREAYSAVRHGTLVTSYPAVGSSYRVARLSIGAPIRPRNYPAEQLSCSAMNKSWLAFTIPFNSMFYF